VWYAKRLTVDLTKFGLLSVVAQASVKVDAGTKASDAYRHHFGAQKRDAARELSADANAPAKRSLSKCD